MADMPNDFWSGWITVLTVVSLLGLAYIVFSVYFSKDTGHGEDEPVWDGNLKEGSTAPPLWWFWLILAAMIISVIYLMLYPGLGSYKGILNWSMDSRLESSNAGFVAEFKDARASIAAQSIDELVDNDAAMQSAGSLFSQNCAACHGQKGVGQPGLFPNLRDDDWQWGGSHEALEQTLLKGRIAAMPAWEAALGKDGVSQVADFVMDFENNSDGHPGKAKYMQFCVACHGADGKGNPVFGAPNLTDNIWVYGGDKKSVVASLANGRNGQMPAFENRLSELQIKLLVAYLSQ